MRTAAIRSHRRRWRARGQRAEVKHRSFAADRERQHRPDLLKGVFRPEPLIPETANRKRNPVIQIDNGLEADGRSENRLALAKCISEFRVVAVEEKVGAN